MKKIIFLLLIYFSSTAVQAQIKISILPTISGTNADSVWVPVVQGTTTKKARGYLFKSTGGSGGISTITLSDSLARIRDSIAAHNTRIITNTANIGLKLNISDTAAMVANYKDSIAAHNTRIITNTANIGLKLNISDTAAMVANYKDSIAAHNLRIIAKANQQSLIDTAAAIRADFSSSGGGGGLDATMAIDGTTTHQYLSTQKIVTKDSSNAYNFKSQMGAVIGDSVTSQTDSILVYGNSIEGAGTYLTTLIGKDYLKTGLYNKGISGTRLVKFANGDSSLEERLYTIPVFRSTLRYIIIGNYAVNDCNLTTGVSLYKSKYLSIIDTLLSRGYPAKKILILTPSVSWSTPLGKNIDTMRLYANATIDVAKEKGLQLVDLFNYMSENGGRSLISSDSIHPNTNGYTAIARAIDLATGSVKANGGLFVRRTATILNGLSVGTNNFIDADNVSTGNFKVQQNSNFIAFNGSTSNSIFQLGQSGGTGYLRFLSQGGSNGFITQNGAGNLNLGTIYGNSQYALGSTGSHSMLGTTYAGTFTGTYTASAVSYNFTSTTPISAYTFSGNNTNSYMRVLVGTIVSGGNALEIGQNGTASRFTGGANGDYNIYGYHASNTSKLFLGVGNTNTPSIVITPTNNNVNIGTSVTEIPSAILNVNSTTKGFLPPRMTTTQRTAIATPAEGLCVYDLTLHKLYVYDGTTWQAAW